MAEFVTDFLPTLSVEPEQKRGMSSFTHRALILSVVTFVTMLVIVTVLFATYIDRTNRTSTVTTPDAGNSIETAYWQVIKSEPVSDTEFNINLESSIGNVRTYEKVHSWGISHNGTLLTLSTATDLKLVELSTNTETILDLPFAYSADRGETISWSSDNKFFALAGIKEQTDAETHILIYESDGKLYKDVTRNVSFQDTASGKVVFPVKFSPSRNVLAFRTYNSEDAEVEPGTPIDLLPQALEVMNVEGVSFERIALPEMSAAQTVIYTWGMESSQLRYQVVNSNTEIDYADSFLFTTITIK